MKTFIITIALALAIPLTSNAQKTQTLFSGDVRHGGFGAPIYGVTTANGQAAYLRGSRGAWVINMSSEHAINIGLGSYRTADEFDTESWTNPDVDEPEMRTNYGGFELEYVNRTHNLFHFSIQTLIGSGHIRYTDKNNDLGRTSDNYFVVQPGINLNLNVTRWFRLSGGVLYRYTNGVNLEGTSDSDLSGPVSFFALRFGKF